MKKIIIALGVVAVSLGVQAATINWAIELATDPVSGDDMGDGNTYYAFFIPETAYARASALAALEGGSASFISTAVDSSTFDYGELFSTTPDTFSNSSTVSGYAVILDADSAAGATMAYITAAGSTYINNLGGSDPLAFGDISAETGDISNWYSLGSPTPPGPSPIPEPTSGLLLLLGVAGLALKRKRM